MSTLGSMARAAEYAAAQSARARQVSHDLEEQKLPPRPAPVSLSAFTKDQPITRNRGNKAWKPLTTDDLGGDGNYSDDIISSREPTPFYPGNDAELHTISRLQMKTTTTESTSNLNVIKIPTAPKAMLMQRDRPALPLDSTPRHLTHPAMSYPQYAPKGPEGTPGQGTQGRLPFNMQQSSNRPSRRSQAAYLHEMQYPGLQTNRADTMPAQPMYGHEQHPAANMTPSREDIEVMREQDRQHMVNMANLQPSMPQYQGPAPPFAALSESPVPYYNPGDHNAAGYPHFNPHAASYDATPPAFYPAQQMNARNDVPNVFSPTPPSYQAPRSNINQATTLYHPEHRKPEIQYDRAQMMEQYKASLAKAAFEKKGKTVLHNPELHKAQSSPYQPSSDNIITDKQSSNEINDDTTWSDLEDIVKPKEKRRGSSHVDTEGSKKSLEEPPYDITKKMQTDVFAGHTNAPRISMTGPPPGLELPMDKSGGVQGNGLKEFPDDFYTLKPISRAEMKRVQQLSQAARDDLSGTFRQPLFSTVNNENINTVRAKEAEDWFFGNHREEVNAYHIELATKMHEAAIRDDALSKKGEEETAMEKAMIAQVIGNVIGNVKNVWDECKLPEERRSYPFKIKPVPEHAIERPSVVTGGASIFSGFFEDTAVKGESEKAFMPTPRRIARDPRFRPAAPKEALTEEEKQARREWNARRGGN